MTFKDYFDSLFFGWTVCVAVMGVSLMCPTFKNRNLVVTMIGIWFGLNVAVAMIVLRRIYAG